MKIYLPTQPNEPQHWGAGTLPPLRLAEAPKPKHLGPSKPEIVVGGAASLRRAQQLAILAGLIFLSIISYHVVTRYVMTAVVIEGRSMIPTLQEGERFILDRWSFHYRNPQRGDLVVIKDPGHQDYAVKRIVGLPGEAMFFRDGLVFLNGKCLLEAYLASGTKTYSPDRKDTLIVVGKDQYFVMGDNRDNSEDSRFYGAVPRERIIGTIAK